MLKRMMVLDVVGCTAAQRRAMAQAYDAIATDDLQPLTQMNDDEVRALMDDGLSRVFGLPSLRPIRAALANEPIVSGRTLAGPEEGETPEQIQLAL
jgi:hypothetical protein